MEAFADYLIAEVYGGTLPAEIDEIAFRKGVALGGSTRGYFQASERWKSDSRNYLANVEANRETKAAEAVARAKAARAKAALREEAAIAKLALAVEAAKAKVVALSGVVEEGSEEDLAEIVSSDELEEDGKAVEARERATPRDRRRGG